MNQPGNIRTPIKHACGHEVEHKLGGVLGSQERSAKIDGLQKELCVPCKEQKRREKDRRRSRDVSRQYIATRLMAAVWKPASVSPNNMVAEVYAANSAAYYQSQAEQAVLAADFLLVALESRRGDGNA